MHAEHTRSGEVADDYLQAFAERNVDAALALFADDAEMVEPPGRFVGKDAIRSLLEWDVRLSSVAHACPSGVGMIAQDGVVVEEELLEQTYEGRPYTYSLVRIFEIDESGQIQRLRVYFDRLGMLQRIAAQLPGLRGRILRALIDHLVTQSEKGLPATARRS